MKYVLKNTFCSRTNSRKTILCSNLNKSVTLVLECTFTDLCTCMYIQHVDYRVSAFINLTEASIIFYYLLDFVT